MPCYAGWAGPRREHRSRLTRPLRLAARCPACRRMFMLLQMHATHCTVPNCQVRRSRCIRPARPGCAGAISLCAGRRNGCQAVSVFLKAAGAAGNHGPSAHLRIPSASDAHITTTTTPFPCPLSGAALHAAARDAAAAGHAGRGQAARRIPHNAAPAGGRLRRRAPAPCGAPPRPPQTCAPASVRRHPAVADSAPTGPLHGLSRPAPLVFPS